MEICVVFLTYVLVSFPVAMINAQKKQLTGERNFFQLLLQGTVHHGGRHSGGA